MTDISKCPGNGCKRKESCWRYTAPENLTWQSWIEAPENPDECTAYWKISMWDGLKTVVPGSFGHD